MRTLNQAFIQCCRLYKTRKFVTDEGTPVKHTNRYMSVIWYLVKLLSTDHEVTGIGSLVQTTLASHLLWTNSSVVYRQVT